RVFSCLLHCCRRHVLVPLVSRLLPNPRSFFRRLFFVIHPATPEIYTLSLHDALPISSPADRARMLDHARRWKSMPPEERERARRSEEHTSELQSREKLVCRLLLEKKKSK